MKKFKIHISFFISSIIFLLSPYQIEYLKIILCIFIHEIGHLVVIKSLKLKINMITLYSFGFIMDLNYYQKTFIKELLIYSSGILSNSILYFVFDIFKESNLILILTNLLPIYPLDGYYIINCILSTILPYKKVLYITSFLGLIPLSIIAIIILIKLDIISLILLVYMINLWITQHKAIPSNYNIFLVYRYNKKEKYKTKEISINKNVFESFYKYRNIYCIYDEKRVDENELLALKYNLN